MLDLSMFNRTRTPSIHVKSIHGKIVNAIYGYTVELYCTTVKDLPGA